MEADKKTWSLMKSQELICPAELNAFVDRIIAGPQAESRTRHRIQEQRNSTLENGEWLTWKKALEYHDQDVLLAMIDAKTLVAEVDSSIPAAVQHPRNLKVPCGN